MATSIVNVPVPTTGDGPAADVSSLVGPKTVILTGTFGGTYTFLVSHDGQTFAPVLTFSSAGLEPIEVTLDDAYASVRLRAHSSSPSNVSVTVAGELGAGQNFFSPVATFTSGGTSPVVDLQALFPPTGLEEEVNFICDGGFTGSVLVEGSNDGVLFNSLGVFQGGASSRPGVSQVLELSPLSTPDKVRYVRVTAAGSISSRVTVTVGGRIPAPAGGGSSLVADWSNVRYIFLDGDAGDDAHLGYIDAPAGTVFTPAQTAPVAVKTTHRVNQIRVPVGAGRMCVVLVKPRAGFAPYDLVATGDGLGSEDRSKLTGYSLLHTRGSDLTNSLADRKQLGYAPSFLGPNPDGSWTVAAVTAGQFGLAIQLTGAVLPASWSLARYQLRFVHAGVTYYAAVRWGAIEDDDPATVNAWYQSFSFPDPGDSLWLETPGAVLSSFTEAAGGAGAESSSGNPAFTLSTAGITVTGVVTMGCSDGATKSVYSHLFVQPGGSVAGYNRGADVGVYSSYTDEANVEGLTSGPGLTAPSMNVEFGAVELTYTSLSTGPTGGASTTSIITADEVDLGFCTLQSSIVGGGALGVDVHDVDHGDFTFSSAGKNELNSVLGITDWAPVVTLNPDFADSGTSFYLSTLFNLRYAAEHSEPASPGVVLANGNYTTTFDFGSAGSSLGVGISAGTGVTIGFANDGSIYTLLTYAGLTATGFEVIGRQKVTCIYQGQGYDGDMLPCPRGTVMKVWTLFEGPVAVDVGTIVGSTLGTGPSDDTIVGAASAFATRVAELVGVTVTDTSVPFEGDSDNEFGYAVVVPLDGQLAVVRRDTATESDTLVTGNPVYLSGQAGDDGVLGAFSLSALNAASYPVGQVAPVGPRIATGPVAVALTWSRPRRQLASTESTFDVSSSTTLADVTDLTVPAEAGKTYRFRAVVPIQSGAGGSRIAAAFSGTAGLAQVEYAYFGISPVALAQAKILPAFGDPGNVVTENVGNGWWQVEGVFEATTLGILSVQFAQASSNPAASSTNAGSYLLIEEK